MPIEIKELVIRTVIDSDVDTRHDGSGQTDDAPDRRGDVAGTEEIVQECVRQVLRVLKMDRGR